MLRRRLVSRLGGIAILLGVAGTLPFGAPASADALDDIKSRGRMIVAIDPTFAPFEYTDSAGKVVGYDPDVLELIAKELGVEVEYQVMAFTGVIPGLIAGSFDFTATALAVRKERAEKIDLTIPLAASLHSIMRKAGDTKVKSADPKDLSGLRVAVKQTTSPETVMKNVNADLESKGLPPTSLLSVDTVEQTVAALLDGRVDAICDDILVLTQVISERPDAKLEIVGNIGPVTYVSWGTNKNDPKLNAELNKQIMALKRSGKLAELQKKHFGLTFDDLPEKDFIPTE